MFYFLRNWKSNGLSILFGVIKVFQQNVFEVPQFKVGYYAFCSFLKRLLKHWKILLKSSYSIYDLLSI